jgi:hypothetical protein
MIHDQEVVFKSDKKEAPIIYLLQRPIQSRNATSDRMQNTLLKSFQNLCHCGKGDYAQIGSDTVTIKGSSSVMGTLEDKSGGDVIQQEFVTFRGNQGLAALMVIGPKREWDEDLVRKFISSIR